MNLYQLSGAYLEILNMFQDEETDQEMLVDTLESLDGAIEEKAENYAKIIKSLECNVDAIKKETLRLENRKKALESNIELLKSNLEHAMRVTGKTRFKTELFSFNIAKNGGVAPLKIDIPIEEIPTEYFKERTERDLNSKYIRECLDKGLIDFAHYEDRGESLRIK